MHEEVRKECGRIERVVPVDGSGVIAVESDLHDDGPDVDTGVQDDDSKQTKLSTASLAETLDIQDKTEAETANTGSKKKKEWSAIGLTSSSVERGTYMQKNGETRDDKARARVEK